jgi:hypothetical protein
MKSIFDNLHDNDKKLQALTGLIEQVMPIQKCNLKLSTKFIAKHRPAFDLSSREKLFPTVIYNSVYCRILFSLHKDRNGYELMVAYGRLHAPDDEPILKWDGEDCYCWHWQVRELILNFLDGVSPQEAMLSRGEPSKGLKDFLGLGLAESFNDVEFPLIYHREIWKYYGKSLFQLFDLRHPELWEEYARFVKEYYDIYRYGRLPNITPSLDKIC